MRIAVVTPVRNAESYVAETIQSIVSQRAYLDGRVELDYLVWDGASTDRTVEMATHAMGPHGRVVSQRDSGMYDGLGQAFAEVGGDVYFYLNAGDLLQPGCFDFLVEAFESQANDWVCGLHLYYSSRGDIVGARLPFRYTKRRILRGHYGRGLPTIQQESTFWSQRLMKLVNLDELRTFKLAGDFYLWHRFAETTVPAIASIALGGFRYHGSHLSADMDRYRAEISAIAGPLRLWDIVPLAAEKALWHVPHRLRKRWSGPAALVDPAYYGSR